MRNGGPSVLLKLLRKRLFLAPFYDGLQVFYKCDETGGTTLYDHSGWNRSGVLQNGAAFGSGYLQLTDVTHGVVVAGGWDVFSSRYLYEACTVVIVWKSTANQFNRYMARLEGTAGARGIRITEVNSSIFSLHAEGTDLVSVGTGYCDGLWRCMIARCVRGAPVLLTNGELDSVPTPGFACTEATVRDFFVLGNDNPLTWGIGFNGGGGLAWFMHYNRLLSPGECNATYWYVRNALLNRGISLG